MNLYRMVYLRDGRTAGATFAAWDAHHAAERAEDWAARWRVQLLTVAPQRSRDPGPQPMQPSLLPA